jgi:hypothetical protein
MRLSNEQIKELQGLLHELTGIEYSPEEAQTAGLAIMRFVYVKELRKYQLKSKEIESNEEIKS